MLGLIEQIMSHEDRNLAASYQELAPSVRFYNYFLLPSAKTGAILGIIAGSNLISGSAFSLKHRVTSALVECGIQGVHWLGVETLVHTKRRGRDFFYLGLVIETARFSRGFIVWKLVDPTQLAGKFLIEPFSFSLSRWLIYSRLVASLAPNIHWQIETGIPAWLAEEKEPETEFLLPINKESLSEPPPTVDYSPPTLPLRDDEVAYLRSKVGAEAHDWKSGAHAYWCAAIDHVMHVGDLSGSELLEHERMVNEQKELLHNTIYGSEARRFEKMEELRGVFIRLADEIMSDNHSKQECQTAAYGVFEALGDCATAWFQTFSKVYRQLALKDMDLPNQIREQSYELKIQAVRNFSRFAGEREEQHRVLSFSHAFGEPWGIPEEEGRRSERLVSEGFADSMRKTGERLRRFSKQWTHVFLKRYTAARLVDHWRKLVNFGDNGALANSVRDYLCQILRTDDMGLSGMGYFDVNEGTLSDKAICIFLAAAGQLTPDEEIGQILERAGIFHTPRQAGQERAA